MSREASGPDQVPEASGSGEPQDEAHVRPTRSSREPLDPKSHAALRIVLILSFVATAVVVGRALDLTTALQPAAIRALVADAGAFGFAVYAISFVAGLLAHAPGMLFVAAGILAFGKLAGFFAAYATGLLAVCASFGVGRQIGGHALMALKWRWAQRMLAQLHARPIRALLVLRLVFWFAPPLNYAAAMTGMRFRDYLAASALGLMPPVAIATLLFDWVFG